MPSQNGPQYFPNASNTVFNNARIMHISGNAYFNNSERQGSKLLQENISKGAFHNAAERGDPPKCHPHTRVAIRAEIMNWVKAPEARRKLVIWMYGPAGAGKTAIAQSIAEECEKAALLAASFFFGRAAPGRNDATRLVATIAYQISRFLPQIEDHILSAIERDPTIFSRTLATQIQVLILEPLKTLPPSIKPIFVILDGIDECGPSPQSQADLLNALGAAISALQHIPFIFLVASRPEYDIREAFNGDALSSITQSLVLDNRYQPDADIKLYFDSKFQEIHDKHLRLGSQLPSPWPSKNDIERLVRKASGQFIFAATVIRFLDSIRDDPMERLDIVLGLSTHENQTPFASLDALYRYILSSVADLPKVLYILTALMLSRSSTIHTYTDHVLAPEKLEKLLGFNVRRALVDMHALIFIPSPADTSSGLRSHHTSLYDFLTDRSRSHVFYIDALQGHLALTRRWSKVLANTQLVSQFSLVECINNFVHHYKKSPAGGNYTEELASFNLRQHLEQVPSWRFGEDDFYWTPWKDFFECVKEQAGDRVDLFPRLQDEFDAFILERVSKYPQALEAFVPTLIAHSNASRSGLSDILRILLIGTNQSTTEVYENRRIDSALLSLYQAQFWIFDSAFPALFQDQSRAGRYYVDGKSYSTLVQQIIQIIFPRPDTKQVQFRRSSGNRNYNQGPYPIIDIGLESLSFGWFAEILSKASIDMDLAAFLRDRALQYKRHVQPVPGRQNIAMASLDYIQRCGLPYLEHTHLSNTNACVICDECDYASVVVDSQLSDDRHGTSLLSRQTLEATPLYADANLDETYPLLRSDSHPTTFFDNLTSSVGKLLSLFTVCRR